VHRKRNLNLYKKDQVRLDLYITPACFYVRIIWNGSSKNVSCLSLSIHLYLCCHPNRGTDVSYIWLWVGTENLSGNFSSACAFQELGKRRQVQCARKFAVHLGYGTWIWLSVSKLPLKCAVISLYSVVKQRLKCNTGKVCNCLIQFLLSMVLSIGFHHFL
jgi:hypothetical protein